MNWVLSSLHEGRVSNTSGFYLRAIASSLNSSQFRTIACNSAKLRATREQLRVISCNGISFGKTLHECHLKLCLQYPSNMCPVRSELLWRKSQDQALISSSYARRPSDGFNFSLMVVIPCRDNLN